MPVRGLRRAPAMASWLVARLGEVPGVRAVSASTLTGRVLVVYAEGGPTDGASLLLRLAELEGEWHAGRLPRAVEGGGLPRKDLGTLASAPRRGEPVLAVLEQGGTALRRRGLWTGGALAGLAYALARPLVAEPSAPSRSFAIRVARWCLTVLAGYPLLRRMASRLPVVGWLAGPAVPLLSLGLAVVQEAALSLAVNSASQVERFRHAYALSRAREQAGLPQAALPPVAGEPPGLDRVQGFASRMNLLALAVAAAVAVRRRRALPVLATLLAANPRPAQAASSTAQAVWIERQVDQGNLVIRPVRLDRVERLRAALVAVEALVGPERLDAVHVADGRPLEPFGGGEAAVAAAVARHLAAAWKPDLADQLGPARDLPPLRDVDRRPEGIRARMDGVAWYLGEAAFVGRRGVSTRRYRARAEVLRLAGARVLWLAADQRVVALLALRRPVAPGAAAALADLRGLGVDELVLAGDLDIDEAEWLVAEVGADAWSPLAEAGQRAAWVTSRRRDGAVLYVGAGLRDGQALQEADVGVLFFDAPRELWPSAQVLLPAGGWDRLAPLVADGLVARELAEQGVVASAGFGLWGLLQVWRDRLDPAGAARLVHLATLGTMVNAHRLDAGNGRGPESPRTSHAVAPPPGESRRVRPMAGGSQALGLVEVVSAGLSQQEAERRLERFGPNRLPEVRGRGLGEALVGQLRDPMVLTLAGAAALSGLSGRWVDAGSIAAILLVNGFLGAYQEHRAERAILSLRSLTRPHALVLRDGAVRQVAAEEVVPGDVLWLEPGERVAADALVLQSRGLEVDESTLTGESVPAAKQAAAPEPGPQPPEPSEVRPDRVYMGSSVVRGHGRAVVLATGAESLMGRTLSLLNRPSDRALTPIQRRSVQLAGQLAVFALLSGAAVALAGWRRGFSASEMLLTGVSMGVAAVPEGLPALVTIGLSVGVQRMARRKALVRRLGAVEEMGDVDVICTDKTGTLTQNRLELHQVADETGSPADGARRRQIVELAALSNRPAAMGGGSGEVFVPGVWADPLEQAIERALEMEGLASAAASREEAEAGPSPGPGVLRDEPSEAGRARSGTAFMAHLPFDAETRYSASLVRRSVPLSESGSSPAGSREGEGLWLLVKGAPETILARCNAGFFSGRRLSRQARERLLAFGSRQASQGLRILAVAGCPVNGAVGTTEEHLRRRLEEGRLRFIGLLFFRDPLRPGVREAVGRMRREGRRVVMVTGDHPQTALSIAGELGLAGPGDPVVLGSQVEEADDATLGRWAEEVAVFARVAPHQKLRIVEVLQARGHRVAMTGEGINDVPAVRRAQVGIALSAGSEVTRETADIVLADDSFETIAASGEEGRRVRRGVESAVGFLVAGNAGEVVTVLGALAMGLPLPLGASHLLLVNLFTDALPALALAVRPSEAPLADDGREVLGSGPSMLDAGRLARRGLTTGLATLVTYRRLLQHGGLALARSGALAAVVGDQLLQLPAWDPLAGRARRGGILGRAEWLSWGSLLAVLYTPARRWFGLQPLRLSDWAWVLGPGLVAALLNGAAGRIRRPAAGGGTDGHDDGRHRLGGDGKWRWDADSLQGSSPEPR